MQCFPVRCHVTRASQVRMSSSPVHNKLTRNPKLRFRVGLKLNRAIKASNKCESKPHWWWFYGAASFGDQPRKSGAILWSRLRHNHIRVYLYNVFTWHWQLYLTLTAVPDTDACTWHWHLHLTLTPAPETDSCTWHWQLQLTLTLATDTGSNLDSPEMEKTARHQHTQAKNKMATENSPIFMNKPFKVTAS